MMPIEFIAGSVRLVLGFALLAAAARRWAPRLLGGGPRAASEVFLRLGLVAAVSMVGSVALLGGLELLGAWQLLAFALALYGAARLAKALPAAWPGAVSRRRAALFWPAALAGAFAAAGVAVYLPASPVNWDAMTYHLYFPARWIQEGRLFHVPTVFSDSSSAFAPQNGALFFAWQMALLGSDATTNVSQVACLAFLAAAVYRLALLSGIRRQAAMLAAASLFWLAPLADWAFTANVDVFMIAFWAGAVYWLRLYLARREWGSLLACGLASGLAAGTKTVGLPLAAVPAGILAVRLLGERRWKELAAAAAAAVGGGGWWYLRNLWLYANPLFPLDFGVGRLRFAGVYTVATLRRGSPFHIEEAERWFRSVGLQLGFAAVVFFAAGLAGLVFLASGVRRHRPRAWVALAAIGFAVAWAWYVFAVVPHNNQARFLLPSLLAASLGWAGWLDAVPSRRARSAVFLLGIGALAWQARPDWAWSYVLDRLEASGVGVGSWMLLAAAVAALGTWALPGGRRGGGRPIRLAAAAVLALTVGLAAHHAARSRIAFLADGDFRAWAGGYLLLDDPSLAPRRIAYSGLNIPYALAGARGQHEVVYCNTQGGSGDGLYEHWARDRRLYTTPGPGIYRGDDDFDVWSSCLEERRIDTVVVFALIPLGRPSHWRLSGEFPIEREWMRRRPGSFRPILSGDRAEIYEVVGLAGGAESFLEHDSSPDHGGDDFEVLQLAGRNREGIAVEDDEIGELPGLEGALQVLLAGGPGVVDGIGAERGLETDPLFGEPAFRGLAGERLPRHRGVDAEDGARRVP